MTKDQLIKYVADQIEKHNLTAGHKSTKKDEIIWHNACATTLEHLLPMIQKCEIIDDKCFMSMEGIGSQPRYTKVLGQPKLESKTYTQGARESVALEDDIIEAIKANSAY